MKKLKLALLAALGVASMNAMACYTVYDSGNRVIYHGEKAPVDMTRHLHETLPRGAHMVFDAASSCPALPVTQVPAQRTVAASARGPLLTDPQTARSLGLPHTVASSGAAVVPAQVVARLDLPSFSVVDVAYPVPTTTALASPMGGGAIDPTRVMGAGPAPGTLLAAPTQDMIDASRGTTTNRMRDQPLTVIDRGHDIRVRR